MLLACSCCRWKLTAKAEPVMERMPLVQESLWQAERRNAFHSCEVLTSLSLIDISWVNFETPYSFVWLCSLLSVCQCVSYFQEVRCVWYDGLVVLCRWDWGSCYARYTIHIGHTIPLVYAYFESHMLITSSTRLLNPQYMTAMLQVCELKQIKRCLHTFWRINHQESHEICSDLEQISNSNHYF